MLVPCFPGYGRVQASNTQPAATTTTTAAAYATAAATAAAATTTTASTPTDATAATNAATTDAAAAAATAPYAAASATTAYGPATATDGWYGYESSSCIYAKWWAVSVIVPGSSFFARTAAIHVWGKLYELIILVSSILGHFL